MHVDLSCAVCGNNNFSLDEAERDDSQVVCRECGHEVGTFGDVKVLLLAELRRPQAERSEVTLGAVNDPATIQQPMVVLSDCDEADRTLFTLAFPATDAPVLGGR